MPSLELIVKPQRSAIYRRLLVSVYVLTVLFIVNSSLYLALKCILIIFLLQQLRFYYQSGTPHPELHELKQQGKDWVISKVDGGENRFDSLRVLIHNPLFQLLQVQMLNKNKILILFNDQLSKPQLRLLHLKSVKN